MTNIMLGDPLDVVALIAALGFLFACGFVAGRLGRSEAGPGLTRNFGEPTTPRPAPPLGPHTTRYIGNVSCAVDHGGAPCPGFP